MTMTLISTVTVGSGGSLYIDFTSIPSTYTDLCLVISSRATAANTLDGIYLNFNSSRTGYSSRVLYGNGSAGVGSYTGSATDGSIGTEDAGNNTANTFSNIAVYIPNYAGSTNKSYSAESVAEDNSSSNATLRIVAGLWSNTSAITSIRLVNDTASNFVQYSTASLYGILKGSGGATVS